MDIDTILKQLEFHRGSFPRTALEQAVAQREAITPALLGILERARREIDRLVTQDSYMAHIYALYLLAEFREPRAYPLIVDFFSIPGEITLDLTGDVVTEDLGRILASVCAGDVSGIERLIENPEANEYVRGAALNALQVLVAVGLRPRAQVMRYCQTLFHGKLERVPSVIWGDLVVCCSDLYPAEVMEDIQQAFAEDLIPDRLVDLKWANARLALGLAGVLEKLKQDPTNALMGSAVAEMGNWASFAPPPPKPPKIGRNERCPCGSGKKYKLCRGAAAR